MSIQGSVGGLRMRTWCVYSRFLICAVWLATMHAPRLMISP